MEETCSRASSENLSTVYQLDIVHPRTGRIEPLQQASLYVLFLYYSRMLSSIY
jgi:hypothetical protein